MLLRGRAFGKRLDPEGGALANGVTNTRGDPEQVIHVQMRIRTHAGSCELREEVEGGSGKASSTENSTLHVGAVEMWKP